MANLLSEFLNTVSLTDNKIYRDAYTKAYSETYRTYPFISIYKIDSKKETEDAELMAVRAGMAAGQAAVLEKLGQLVEEAKINVLEGIDHGKEKLKELIVYTRLSDFSTQAESVKLAGRLRTLRRSRTPRYLRNPRRSRKPKRN
jgi:hypothetical protein